MGPSDTSHVAHACARVRCVLIHPQDARRAGGRARRAGVSSKVDHARHSTVASILDDGRLRQARLGRAVDVKPEDRLVLSCDHHALLMTGMLRHLGVAVRARAGAADYLVAGQWRAHWLVEVRLDDGSWALVDPERVRLDVPRSSFMTGGSLWLADRETAAPPHAPTRRGPARMAAFSGYTGWSALRYALLCDVTALLRAELIGYDWRLSEAPEPKPLVLRTPVARLSHDHLRLLDDAARLAEVVKPTRKANAPGPGTPSVAVSHGLSSRSSSARAVVGESDQAMTLRSARMRPARTKASRQVGRRRLASVMVVMKVVKVAGVPAAVLASRRRTRSRAAAR